MAQPATASKPRTGFSRFSKALPAVPQLRTYSLSKSSKPSKPSSSPPSTSHQLPPLPKVLPDLPPPPPPPPRDDGPAPAHASAPPQLPQVLDKSPPLSLPGAFPPERGSSAPAQKMSIPRRPVNATSNATLSPFPEPSPTASLSSLISAYTRPLDSPSTALPTGAYPDTPLASSRETTPPPHVPEKSSDNATTGSKPPPRPIAKESSAQKDVPPAPPSKSELWRRRPQNDSREISGLKLDHSHGSTVSSAMSIMSTSTASTQRPSTAVQDEPSQPARLRKLPSVNGLPGRNVRPSPAAKDDSRPATTSSKPTIAAVNSKKSLSSLRQAAATPPSNRPPTPEYQTGESRATVITTFTSPVSPASSPESPSRFSPATKDFPVPPPRNPIRDAVNTAPKLPSAAPSSLLTDMPRRKPATTTSPANVDAPAKPQPPSVMSPSFPGLPPRARTPLTASTPSDQSRGSSASPTRQNRRDQDPTPRQQRRPASDQRIVQTEQGPMYRGRDGTLYPEMKNLREPDPRAFRFPAWKGSETTTVSTDGVYAARELKESHYSCFQKHATMGRRSNRHYPLTCQTCNKANADDRWACTFCHLRICEPCFRSFDTNQRDLKKLVADIGCRTPLRLSSGSRPASAFGL